MSTGLRKFRLVSPEVGPGQQEQPCPLCGPRQGRRRSWGHAPGGLGLDLFSSALATDDLKLQGSLIELAENKLGIVKKKQNSDSERS